jgi:CRISPR-associated endonuclease/helicase Cas3
VFAECILGFFKGRGAALPWQAPTDGPLVQRLAGLCAVADWIGSDVEHLPYQRAPADLELYWTEAVKRASVACEHAGLIRATPATSTFTGLFPDKTPRDVQILTESLQLNSPALVIVEAEMGKGKTEAALSLAARCMHTGAADGITIALPTMATSNAMFERVEKCAARLFSGGEVQLALAHGRARRQPRFMALANHRLQERDPDAPEASVTCARWLLNRKRILLAQLGVGTIDQALQAALVVRHQFVRMFSLSRNVVIIDEVHAYDAYMEVLLEHLLAWLGALRVPVILLSATLPSERREALARAWRGEPAQGPDVPATSLGSACARPYPLVSVTTPQQTRTITLDNAGPSRTLKIERAVRCGESRLHETRVAERLVSAARAGARVVWIRNTVGEAQRAFGVVAANGGGVERRLFHARFRGCDRSRIEQAVLAGYGKRAPSGGRVLVATQVVEQSLDLDFDEMHTDLAPVDLLLQRAGRLHRHDRRRPAGHEEPHLIVHVPSDGYVTALRFGPSQYVYDIGTLWLADRALRSRPAVELPGDIRALVEETYHPDSRAELLPSGGPKLVEAERRLEDQLAARRTRAKQCCIPPTTADPDGEGALDDEDDTVQAFTRDGSSVTILPLWWDGQGARSLDARDSAVAWHLDSTAGDAWRLAGALLDETLSLSARGAAEGVPGKASSAWDAWRTRFERFAIATGLGARIVPVPLQRESGTHKGWLRMGGRVRRVSYSSSHGLLMPSEKGEEQQR